MREIASRQYLKKKREQGWDNFKIDWPSEFPTALRAKIEGGVWEDFKKFIVNFIKHDSFGKGAHTIHSIAQGTTGKKLDEWNGDNFTNRPRMITFTAEGVKTPLAGAFELDGRIYSLFNETSYQAPQEFTQAQYAKGHPRKTIPEFFSTLVTQGLSENERDKLDGTPLYPRLRSSVGLGPRMQWPYFTYEKRKPGEFARDMMKRFVEKFEDDMDWSTYSHKEQNWNTAAMFMELGLVSLPIGAVAGPLVGAGMALLSTVPYLIRMAVADNREESKEALDSLLLGLLFEVIGSSITPALNKVFGKLAKRKSQKLLQDISTNPHAPVIKLEDLENWAIEVRGKVKGRLDISDADVDKLVDSSGSGARGVGAGSVNGESWLQKLGYTSSGLYQRPKKVVSKGSVGTVYEIDDNFLRKDYSGILDESHHGRLTKAQNTVAAMDRLYGPGSAEVQIWNTKNPLEKIVTVKMKRIPGESLDSLLKKGDIRVLNEVLMWYHESDPVNELVTRLSTNGINYNDINLANTLFDKKLESFTWSTSTMFMCSQTGKCCIKERAKR